MLHLWLCIRVEGRGAAEEGWSEAGKVADRVAACVLEAAGSRCQESALQELCWSHLPSLACFCSRARLLPLLARLLQHVASASAAALPPSKAAPGERPRKKRKTERSPDEPDMGRPSGSGAGPAWVGTGGRASSFLSAIENVQGCDPSDVLLEALGEASWALLREEFPSQFRMGEDGHCHECRLWVILSFAFAGVPYIRRNLRASTLMCTCEKRLVRGSRCKCGHALPLQRKPVCLFVCLFRVFSFLFSFWFGLLWHCRPGALAMQSSSTSSGPLVALWCKGPTSCLTCNGASLLLPPSCGAVRF